MAKRAPPGFFKRNRKWHVRTDPVTGKARGTGCTDLDAAIRWHRQRQRLAADPEYAAEADQGINHWAQKLIAMKKRHRSPATERYYRQKLGHVVRIFGAASPVSSFRPAGWDSYVTQRLGEGASPNTIGKEIKAGQLVAKLAKRAGVFRGDVTLFKPPDFDPHYEPRDRALTPEEWVKLAAVLNPRHLAWCAANIAFAGRRAEVERGQPEDVNIELWTVSMRGSKTKRSKGTIPIAEPFRPLVLLALPFLPLGPWGNMVRDLAAACRRAGIPRVTSNDLRRTHATWLEEAGVPHSTIATVLRHTSERMVRLVYGRARPEKLGQAMQALIDAAKPLQHAPPKETETENPNNVEVAQSVEQRTEKPDFDVDGVATSGESSGNSTAEDSTRGASGDAESRGVRNRNVASARAARAFRMRSWLWFYDQGLRAA